VHGRSGTARSEPRASDRDGLGTNGVCGHLSQALTWRGLLLAVARRGPSSWTPSTGLKARINRAPGLANAIVINEPAVASGDEERLTRRFEVELAARNQTRKTLRRTSYIAIEWPLSSRVGARLR
jgi:hypothetical protein